MKQQTKIITLSVIGFMLCLYGFIYSNQISQGLPSIGLQVFSKAKAENNSSNKVNKEKKNPTAKSTENHKKESKSKSMVFKDSSFINALSAKEQHLDEREVKVKKLEKKLQKKVVELDEKIKKLETIRRDISSKLKGQVERDNKNITKLVGVYSNMKPQNAAYLISQLNEELAVRVLKKLKKRQAGSILNFIDAKKAKVLSEKYSGY